MADRGSMVYYGICDTAAGEQVKVVNVANPVFKGERLLDLVIGDILVVKFDNGNTNTNPKIQLKITEPNQNIGVSADTGLTVATEERYDWTAQGIVSFVYTYIGSNNGASFSEEGVEITSENSTEVVANYAWKPIEVPLASDDVYGVTKLITNKENLTGNENQPVSYSVIQEQLSNGLANLGLKFLPNEDENNKNIYGTLSISSDGDTEILLPVWTKKTSQLVNDGAGEGDRFWSSKVDNYVNETDLGIGYLYTPNVEGASQTVMKSFIPYGTIPAEGFEKPVNIIRIGKDALNAYQTGVEIAEDVLVEPNPHVRLYGKNISLAMDENGEVSIGLADVSNEPEAYNKEYIFTKDGATFNSLLNANGGVKAASIVYNNKELEDRLTYFYIRTYTTPVITYNAATSSEWAWKPKESVNYRLDGKTGSTMWFEIPEIEEGYRPVGVVGYNLNEAVQNSDTSTPSRINVWECYMSKNENGKYYFNCALSNSSPRVNKVTITYKILFVKDGLVK